MLQKYSKAFSLAEAVITLIFLSIIAAQLIPAVNASRPSTEKLLFKKAYSTIENTISNILNDDNLYPSEYMVKTCNNITEKCPQDFVNNDISNNTTDTNLNGSYYAYHAIVDSSKCTNGDKLLRLFCASLNTTQANCSAHACTFTTTDGMIWTVTHNATKNKYAPMCCHSLNTNMEGTTLEPILTIMVDVNGNAEPNTHTNVNIPDQYYINVYYNGKIEVNKTLSPKGIAFLKNPTNNKRRSDLEDDRFGKD